mgnify:CR=1 FL=1
MNEAPPVQENTKVIEPTFHFISEQLKIGDDYTTATIPVTELVEAAQLLADFPNFHQFEAKGFTKARIEPGENVHISEDEESILATVPGYPKVRTIGRPGSANFMLEVSLEPLFVVSDDSMSASLIIHPPLDYGSSLKNKNIEQLLADQGIVYGVNGEAIESAREFFSQGVKEFKKIVVASGQPVGKSFDAYLRFDMEIGPIAGMVMADGTIDFRDRKIMVGVHAGQQIATKIPPVEGTPGINVYGVETPAREPRDLKIELLNDAKYSPETRQVTATKDGVLSIVNNNVIRVCSNPVSYTHLTLPTIQL